MKKILCTLFLIGMSAHAAGPGDVGSAYTTPNTDGILLSKTMNSRAGYTREDISLDKTSDDCTSDITTYSVWSWSDNAHLKSAPASSEVCNYLKAANEISVRLSSHYPKDQFGIRSKWTYDSQVSSDERMMEADVVTGKIDPKLMALEQATYDEDSHSTMDSMVCVHVKVDYKKGMTSISPEAIEGPNYKETFEVRSLSAAKCAAMFKTDEEKSIVLEVFRKYGLQ